LSRADHRVSFYADYQLNTVAKNGPATLIAELLVMLAAIMLLFALAEFARSKNQEFASCVLRAKPKETFCEMCPESFSPRCISY